MNPSPPALATDGSCWTNPRALRVVAIVLCALLLVGYALLARSAVRTKSASWDEPLHVLSAYMGRQYQDFRLDPPNPPLWTYSADLPHARGSIQVDLNSPIWRMLPDQFWEEHPWIQSTLYRTPAN